VIGSGAVGGEGIVAAVVAVGGGAVALPSGDRVWKGSMTLKESSFLLESTISPARHADSLKNHKTATLCLSFSLYWDILACLQPLEGEILLFAENFLHSGSNAEGLVEMVFEAARLQNNSKSSLCLHLKKHSIKKEMCIH
jgi:hypothetical protein